LNYELSAFLETISVAINANNDLDVHDAVAPAANLVKVRLGDHVVGNLLTLCHTVQNRSLQPGGKMQLAGASANIGAMSVSLKPASPHPTRVTRNVLSEWDLGAFVFSLGRCQGVAVNTCVLFYKRPNCVIFHVGIL